MLMIDLSSPIAFQNEYIHYSTPNVWTLAFTAAVAYLLAKIVGFWHIYVVQWCLDNYTLATQSQFQSNLLARSFLKDKSIWRFLRILLLVLYLAIYLTYFEKLTVFPFSGT